jgi:HicA toxin of bacterial toxin-antitoxin,
MASAEKNLQKMRNNPRDWRMEDLEAIAKRFGIEQRKPGGSHVYFIAPNGNKLSVPAHKPIKTPYVRQFIALVDSLKETS